MKTSSWIIGAIALGLAACSSTETRTTENMTAKERYISHAEQQVEYWEERVDDLDERGEAQFEPYVADLKADLSALKSSREAKWNVYRDRIENSINNLQSKIGAE